MEKNNFNISTHRFDVKEIPLVNKYSDFTASDEVKPSACESLCMYDLVGKMQIYPAFCLKPKILKFVHQAL